MTNKKKLVVFNLLIAVLSIIIVLLGAISTIIKLFDTEKAQFDPQSVSAHSEITFNKTGLLNLLESELSFTPSKPMSIKTQQDVLDAYDKYLKENFETGKVVASGYTFMTGSGSLGGVTSFYNYILEEEISMKDGSYRTFSKCCEIPNASGKFGKFSKNTVREDVWKDGVHTVNMIEGYEDVATYTKNNNKYDVVVVNQNYNKTKSYEKAVPNYFEYVLSSDAIDSCEIDDSSSFIVKAKLVLNPKAYEVYESEVKIMDEGDNKVSITSYVVEISFNKYTGDIIQITRNVKHTAKTIVTIDLDRNCIINFKKNED